MINICIPKFKYSIFVNSWFNCYYTRMAVIFRNERQENNIISITVRNGIVKTYVRGNLIEIFIEDLNYWFRVIDNVISFTQDNILFNIISGINERFDCGPKMLVFWSTITSFSKVLTLRLNFSFYTLITLLLCCTLYWPMPTFIYPCIAKTYLFRHVSL